VQLTRYPPGLISALEKLKGDTTVIHSASKATAHLWIEEPLDKETRKGQHRLNHLFDTHPPLDDRIRALQRETGGFTEFVPLPFVHMEAPMWRKGFARSGPTWREAVLMHAVSRIVFDADIGNIQTSWVKLGPDGAAAMLQAGANDVGGTLMDESITRAAGGVNGQHFDADGIAAMVAGIGRPLAERDTLYRRVSPQREPA